MISNHYRERLETLFADIDWPAADPAAESASMRREIEALRARICELEAEILESAKRAAEQENTPPSVELQAEDEERSPRRAAPILYEKEQVGYVYAGDGVQPLRGQPTETPESSDSIVAPLIASGQTIGKMQVQPSPERAWTQEERVLLNAVAQQASVQIENLRLLDATERARAEAEAATRRFMHENWDSYLDGIHHSERVGYAYDQASVTPFFDKPASNGGFKEMVNVMEEQVGLVYLQPDPSRPLTNEDKAMVASIAKQIAQQVENIRLLDDASRARAEAEEATRRLTHESWQAYAAQQDDANLGFAYNANQVIPLKALTLPQETNLAHPLTVRGEIIGQLVVANWKEVSPEAADLTAAIAERVSTHLETLRLAEELQKRAAELEEATNFLDSVVENLPIMLFVKDAKDLRMMRWNRAGEEIVGFSRQELIGKTDYDFFPKDEADFFVSKDREVLAGGKLIDIPEEPIQTAHQGMRLLHTRKIPVAGIDGKPKYLLGISEDITERKQAEETLRRQHAYQGALQEITLGLIGRLELTDLLQNIITRAGELIGTTHGYIFLLEPDEAEMRMHVGTGTYNSFVDYRLKPGQAVVGTIWQTGEPLVIDDYQAWANRLHLKNLEAVRAVVGAPLKSGSQVVGVISLAYLEEGRRFGEDEVAVLSRFAQLASVALDNARLYAEQTATVARLRELDQLKSSFLANMSHELRTPLNSILGFAEVMLEGIDGDLTDRMDNDLQVIYKNGQHLLTLINDILDMAKIEAGKMSLTIERFNLQEVLEEVAALAMPLAQNKSLELRLETGITDYLEVEADRIRLRQVMINLVNNAIKFTESGWISINARLTDAHMLISIHDTGVGVPPNQLETIFQEFHQVDSSTTRKASGTGLGLPISRHLIELHNGRLWAESSGASGPEGGATFFVELPAQSSYDPNAER